MTTIVNGIGCQMKFGYVRVSKHVRHEEFQIDALKEAGCEKWFVDKVIPPPDDD